MLIFGSVLPDIAWLSDQKVWKNKLHNNPDGFYRFVSRDYPQLKELALGVKLHCYANKGADYYSDDPHHGFAKKEAHWFVTDVAKLLQFEQNGLDIRWNNFTINSNLWICKILHVNNIIARILAHSVVEYGVDMNLLKHHHDIVTLYTKTCKNINISSIQHCLTQYLQISKYEVLHKLTEFIKLLNPPHGLTSIRQITHEQVVPLLETRLKRKFNQDEVEQLLIRAQKHIESKYLCFLTIAITEMKHNFKNFL